MSQRRRILIIGAGDLGARILVGLATNSIAMDILLVGRRSDAGSPLARLAASCGDAHIEFIQSDAEQTDELAELFQRLKPDLIVQCASKISPWLLSGRSDSAAELLRGAGFATQISAQLPVVLSVMRAVHYSGYPGPVVNCSYPDVTNPVLKRLGLAPTIGVGNCGMILGFVQDALKATNDARSIRLLAHHSHVRSVLCDIAKSIDKDQGNNGGTPRVFLGNEERRIADVLANSCPLLFSKDLNILTAAHAIKVIHALLFDNIVLRTSAPGPRGLPGGWPVRIADGRIELDLPASITEQQVIDFNNEAAQLDGVRHIDDDGTIHFTETSIRALPTSMQHLLAPLQPEEAAERFSLLARLLRSPL